MIRRTSAPQRASNASPKSSTDTRRSTHHSLTVVNVNRLTRLRRWLLLLSAAAAAWALVVALTGGFVVRFAFIRLSSRSPRNSILLALLCVLAVGVLTPDWRGEIQMALSRCKKAGSLLMTRLSRHWPWLKWMPPVLIALVGIGLEIDQWAGARPLWLDEEMIALNLRDRTLAELGGTLWLGQTGPLGWLAVQRAMLLTFGTSELALRLVPMLFGVATLSAALWIGLRWMSPVGAVVLTLLCAFGHWLSFYSLELKHYSADTFWSMLLPPLAAWAAEPAPDGPSIRTRRVALWWGAAAFGHWFANGALLVTPACALVLFIVFLRRSGRHAARTFAWCGLWWAGSFALHFELAVRHTLTSEFLRTFWSGGFPPPAAGLSGTVAWLAAQLEPFAIKPGGTVLWALFWLSATCGFVLSPNPILGLVLATVPLSAFVLAALRIVPFYERTALWVVPALYIGLSLFADSTVRFGREAYLRRSWTRAAFAVVTALVGLQVSADIFWRGKEDLQVARPIDSNRQLDDRAGVKWLMERRQPGDALMATWFALPAVWWYGGIPISDPDFDGSYLPDGSPFFLVDYAPPGRNCSPNELRAALDGRRRVLVYFGFGFGDLPTGFDDLLLHSLGELGVITAAREFAEIGRALVVDLSVRQGSFDGAVAAGRPNRASGNATTLDGCITVRPARRW